MIGIVGQRHRGQAENSRLELVELSNKGIFVGQNPRCLNAHRPNRGGDEKDEGWRRKHE
jgi:hypothetical protein